MAGALHQIVLYTKKGEDRLFTVVNRIMASKNYLQFCIRVLARISSAVDQRNRAKINEDMSKDRLKLARTVINIVSGMNKKIMVTEKDLQYLIRLFNYLCKSILKNSPPEEASIVEFSLEQGVKKM